jgi:hypothetical protein
MATQIYQAPYQDTESITVPPVAITTTVTTPVFEAPVSGVITAATYAAVAAVAGVTTNTRTLTLQNLTQGLTIATLALITGVNMVANVAKTMTITAANANVNSGDIIAFVSTFGGTGIADPGGITLVTFSGVDSHVAQSPYYETPATQPTGADPLHLGVLSI